MKKFVYQKLLEHEREDWWNRALRNIVLSYLKKYSKVKHGLLLDVGFGTGFLLEKLKSDWKTFGIDNSKFAVAMAQQRGLKNIKLASADKIPFPANFFDAILVLDVLEHIKNELPVLEEIRRVLKPGGIVVFNNPAYQFLWSYHDETAKHFRRYTTSEFSSKLQKSGFQILKLTYINFFLFPIALVHRLSARIKKPKEKKSDVGIVPDIFQTIFYKIFSSEIYILRFINKVCPSINFPWGLSVSCVATKTASRLKPQV